MVFLLNYLIHALLAFSPTNLVIIRMSLERLNNKYLLFSLILATSHKKMQEELSSLFTKYFNDIQLNILLINNMKIGSFFHYKDRLLKDLRAFLIYKFSSLRCASEYIGSTTRALCVRVAEHAGRIIC